MSGVFRQRVEQQLYKRRRPVLSVVATGPSVTDVNTDEIILDGEAGVTFAYSNYVSTPTDADIIVSGVTAKTAGTSFSAGAGTGSFSVPDVSAYASTTAGAPFTTASHAASVEISVAAETDSLAITYNPAANWAVFEVSSVSNVEGSFSENFTGAVPDTSQVLCPDDINITATGMIQTDRTTNADCQYWDATLETWQQFTIEIELTGFLLLMQNHSRFSGVHNL